MSLVNVALGPFQPLREFFSSPPPVVNLNLAAFIQRRPKLASIASIAINCLARVLDERGQHLGCCMLIGIDRVAMPFHLLQGTCLDKLNVEFYRHHDELKICYVSCCKIWKTLDGSEDHDWAFLQLSPIFSGYGVGDYPGHHHLIPSIVSAPVKGSEFIFAHVDNYNQRVLSLGTACSQEQFQGGFCGYVSTQAGSSGGISFTRYGAFGFHQRRSTGVCGISEKAKRSFILTHVLAHWIFQIPKCQPLPPQSQQICFSLSTRPSVCEAPEGRGKPAINGTLTVGKTTCKYWESFPTNASGPGPRSIQISVSRLNITYKLSPNPHDVPKYNKNQEALYREAAIAFCKMFQQNQPVPVAFNFTVYNILFTATFENSINYATSST